jgi:hypothetical protein
MQNVERQNQQQQQDDNGQGNGETDNHDVAVQGGAGVLAMIFEDLAMIVDGNVDNKIEIKPFTKSFT